MEIKVPKEVRQHRENIFFGLSARQFLCGAMAVGAAVGVYLNFSPLLGPKTAGWMCMLCAAPLAAAAFFNYNGLTLERFVLALVRFFLRARPRPYVSENYYYTAIQAGRNQRRKRVTGRKRKEVEDHAQDPGSGQPQ